MGYWALSIGLIVFGVVGIFSIGQPLLLIGITLLVLGRLRRRPVLFWPPLSGVIGYVVGYWAIVPLYCSATEVTGGVSMTTCSSLIGVQYSGSGAYNPSHAPADLVGLLLGAIALIAVLVTTLWQGRASSRVFVAGRAEGA